LARAGVIDTIRPAPESSLDLATRRGTTMYDYSSSSRPTSYDYGLTTAQPAIVGKVLGLLGFSFLFTAGGALLGPQLGVGGLLLGIVGSLGTLIALFVLKERAPINLVLLYSFATFSGMSLGLILEQYLARGLGTIVLNAAATTGAVTLAAGAYGYTTKRNLSGLGGVLMIGLIAVVLASLVGIFVQLPALYLGISVVSALLFTGFLVFDLNRVANARGASEGDTILLAVSVYLDIFNLFLALLRIFGIFGSSDD
jgi:modulator of FtsH protease